VFTRRVFGPRVYLPSTAARGGLELLRNGGYLVVLADFYGTHMHCLFGREIPVATGPIWWAQRSGRPIVPYLVYPPRGRRDRWHLRYGDPIPPTRTAIAGAVEDSIRSIPASWMSWRGWYTSQRCNEVGSTS